MSVQAITWAFAANIADPIEKFVLVALANYADDFGVCWPSQSTLVMDCSCSERKLRESLKSLEAAGLIKRVARRRQNGSRRSDAVVLSGFTGRRIPRSADEHPVLALLDVVDGSVAEAINRHHAPVDNRHHVPPPPAPRAALEPSLEPSETTTGACDARDPWLDACLAAMNPDAVDAGALSTAHELLGVWRRAGYDLETVVLPVLAARTEAPRVEGQLIRSWGYFRVAMRTAHSKRLRQAERAKIAENSDAQVAASPPETKDLAVQMAAWINGDGFVPSSAVSTRMRNEMLGRGLVSAERLRDRGIY